MHVSEITGHKCFEMANSPQNYRKKKAIKSGIKISRESDGDYNPRYVKSVKKNNKIYRD